MEANLEEGSIVLKILLFILVLIVVGGSFIYFSKQSQDITSGNTKASISVRTSNSN